MPSKKEGHVQVGSVGCTKCGLAKGGGSTLTCEKCGLAWWCGQECRDADSKFHAELCDRVHNTEIESESHHNLKISKRMCNAIANCPLRSVAILKLAPSDELMLLYTGADNDISEGNLSELVNSALISLVSGWLRRVGFFAQGCALPRMPPAMTAKIQRHTVPDRVQTASHAHLSSLQKTNSRSHARYICCSSDFGPSAPKGTVVHTWLTVAS